MSQLQTSVKSNSYTQLVNWIECELADTYFTSCYTEKNLNALLELRALVSTDASLNKLVKGFYALLPRLERNYYLLGYRIRHWISLHCSARVSDPLSRLDPVLVPICPTTRSLDGYRKDFLEVSDYAVLFHDIRVEVIAN